MKKRMVVSMALLLCAFCVKLFATPDGNVYISKIEFTYQEFSEFNKDRKEFVIDDHVNIRNEGSTNSTVIDQLNAGDQVYVIDTPDAWLKVEGVYAPWYKIKYVKNNTEKTGYICGKFISYKWLISDIDNDGTDEIIVTVYAQNYKDQTAPWGENYNDFKSYIYKVFYIKNATVFNMSEVLNKKHSMDEDIKIIADKNFIPEVKILNRELFAGIGGSYSKNERLFYFMDNTWNLIGEFSSYGDEESELTSEIIYPSDKGGEMNTIIVIIRKDSDITETKKYVFLNNKFINK